MMPMAKTSSTIVTKMNAIAAVLVFGGGPVSGAISEAADTELGGGRRAAGGGDGQRAMGDRQLSYRAECGANKSVPWRVPLMVSAIPNATRAPDPDDRTRVTDPVAREESVLVRRVQQGDIDAFDVLVRRYLERAYRVAYRVVQHRQDAEDLVQESFLRALERIDQCATDRPFGPWFLRIVMTQGINATRQRKRRETSALPEDAVAGGIGPDIELERATEHARLHAAINRLPNQQRLILQLSVLEGFSSQEIADMMDMAAGTVRWHLHQARSALRAVLVSRTGERRND